MSSQKLIWWQQLLIISLLLMIAFPAFSQKHKFNQITENEGLPSNDIYDMLLSVDGRIWFSSDNGVSRYDGSFFENISVDDGISESTIIKLYADYADRIWLLAYDGTLSYYEDGLIQNYPYNDSIIKYFPDNYLNKIYVDPSGSVLLSPRAGGKACIDKFGNIQPHLSDHPAFDDDSCFLLIEDKGDDHFMTVQNSKPEGCLNNGPLYYRAGQFFLRVKFNPRQFQRSYAKLSDDEYLVSYRKCVYHIRDNEIISRSTFRNEVLSIFKDKYGSIWVSEKFDRGVYRYEDPDLKQKPERFLEGYTVTSILQDHEGGYWFSTEGDGVMYTPGFEFMNHTISGNKPNLNITALTLSGNRLWFATRDKEIFSGRLEGGLMRNIRKLTIEEPYDWVNHMLVDNEGYLWLSSTPNIRYDPAGFPRPPDTIIHSYYIGKAFGDTIFACSKDPAYFHNGRFMRFLGPRSVNRVYSTYHDSSGVLLGTLYGLYKFSKGQLLNYGNQLGMDNVRINCLDRIRDLLVIGTSAEGLRFIHHDSIEFTIGKDHGLLSNNIKALLVENDSTLWVGTRGGLHRILLSDNPYSWDLESFSTVDGLPANEIISMVLHEGHLWLGTAKGLSSVNIRKLKPHTMPPIIELISVKINGRDTLIQDEYVLSHDQNDIRITFTGISYRMAGELKYRYQMTNMADQITLTRNNWVDFPNLPPGDYTFYLNVGNKHNIWNERPVMVRFSIDKPFTQTLGFMIGMIALTLIFMIAISRFLQRQRKIKQRAREELARMEQKIFRLQMNPHFVFNALLAIQGFMYQKNARDAGRYLTSFAKLIRHTLYGSREDQVPLNNELEAMKYYLELQRLRFNDNFDFKIDIDDHIFTESVRIPPLLIQPFLENAIEHGLQHKNGKGELRLGIMQEGDMLVIEIEDNGIGRDAAMQLQKKKGKLHKSLGMEIVKSRLESLRKVIGKKIDLKVSDLLNDDGSIKGTLVRIRIQI